MRIAKYIANAGVCSRRDAEKLIEQKKVFINNIRCKHPSTLVTLKDKIIVNKKIIILESEVRLWKMYKPTKVICTNKDPQHRKTIFDLIPKNYPRLISIGRLDFMSEGLSLLQIMVILHADWNCLPLIFYVYTVSVLMEILTLLI